MQIQYIFMSRSRLWVTGSPAYERPSDQLCRMCLRIVLRERDTGIFSHLLFMIDCSFGHQPPNCPSMSHAHASGQRASSVTKAQEALSMETVCRNKCKALKAFILIYGLLNVSFPSPFSFFPGAYTTKVLRRMKLQIIRLEILIEVRFLFLHHQAPCLARAKLLRKTCLRNQITVRVFYIQPLPPGLPIADTALTFYSRAFFKPLPRA